MSEYQCWTISFNNLFLIGLNTSKKHENLTEEGEGRRKRGCSDIAVYYKQRISAVPSKNVVCASIKL